MDFAINRELLWSCRTDMTFIEGSFYVINRSIEADVHNLGCKTNLASVSKYCVLIIEMILIGNKSLHRSNLFIDKIINVHRAP